MGTAIERTAKADFKVGDDGIRVDDEARSRGFLVKAGQVLEIPSKTRLKKLVDAGLVAATDEEDADVPKLTKPTAAVELTTAAQAKRAAAIEARRHADKAQADLEALKAKTPADSAAIAAAETAAADAARAAEAAEKDADSAQVASA